MQWVSKLIDKIARDGVATEAAALAYYTVLSTAPLLLILYTVLSSLGLSLQQQILSGAKDLMGPQPAKTLEFVFNYAERNPLAGRFGVVALLFSASVVFYQLQNTLNRIFKVQSQDSLWDYIWRRLRSFVMVLTFVFATILFVLATITLSFITDSSLAWWGKLIQFISSVGLYTLIFALIFRWMPDGRVSWRASWLGGLSTAVIFTLGGSLIGGYFNRVELSAPYGAAGSIIVFLVWAYVSSFIILTGAEIVSLLSARILKGEPAWNR